MFCIHVVYGYWEQYYVGRYDSVANIPDGGLIVAQARLHTYPSMR